MNKDSNDILRLNFENFIWIVFITICVLNIIADNDEKKFINTIIQYIKQKQIIFLN